MRRLEPKLVSENLSNFEMCFALSVAWSLEKTGQIRVRLTKEGFRNIVGKILEMWQKRRNFIQQVDFWNYIIQFRDLGGSGAIETIFLTKVFYEKQVDA